VVSPTKDPARGMLHAAGMRYLLLAAALWAAPSATALACTYPPCPPRSVVLHFETTLPSNAFFFEVLADDPGPLRLRDRATGEPIAASIKTLGADRVYSPDVPLTVGREVELEFDTSGEGCAPRTQVFTVGPAGDLTAVLAPTLLVSGQGYSDVPSSKQAFVRAQYEVPNVPASLLRTTWKVDGQVFQEVGGVGAYPFELRALCGGGFSTDCGGPDSLTPEAHVIEVTTRVLGGASVTQRLEVDLRCDKGGGNVVVAGDAGVEKEGDDGCALGGSGVGGWAWLALLLRRRRR
jgi:hypothetical protein